MCCVSRLGYADSLRTFNSRAVSLEQVHKRSIVTLKKGQAQKGTMYQTPEMMKLDSKHISLDTISTLCQLKVEIRVLPDV